jgi:hypothetical protein
MCYRRLDSEEVVDRIYESFEAALPKEALFRDIDTIPPGVDFRNYVQEALRNCHVVLVFIGRDWLGAADERGARRLDNPRDHVRIEVETALEAAEAGARLIPVLVRRASMPQEGELPASLAALCFRHAVTIRTGADYHTDVGRLIGAVQEALTSWAAEKAAKASAEKAKVAAERRASIEPSRLGKKEPLLVSDLELPAGTIYISHADEDRDSARRIMEALAAASLSVWSTQIGGTLAFREDQARKALEQCALFMPLISQHTEAYIDGFFRHEWKWAASSGRPIVPVVVDPKRARGQRGVLYPRHYDVQAVPPEFENLATTSCPGGQTTPEFIDWAKEAVKK